MRLIKHFPLYFVLLSSTLITGGCSVFQEIQNWSGNRIEIIDDLTTTSDVEGLEHNPLPTQQENEDSDEQLQSPKAHQRLDKILQDQGQGKYAGDEFNQQKFKQALDLMPKGLTEEKIYAYLLGLVGESYFHENDLLNQIAHTHYQNQLAYFQSQNKQHVNKAQPKKAVNLVILLDANYSMSTKMNGKRKLQLAQEEIEKFCGDLPKETSFTIRTYGPQSPDKKIPCSQSEKFFAGLKQPHKQESHSLSTAIDYAYQDLRQMDKKQTDPQNMILIISDFSETDDEILKKVQASKAKAEVHLIGLDVKAKTEKKLNKVFNHSNGNFESVSTQKELRKVLKLNSEDIVRVNEPWHLRATDKITRDYVSDKMILNKNIEKITKKVEQEHQRLTEANQYIKEHQAIDQDDWDKLDDIIEKRKDQVKQYADDRLNKIDTKLQQEFNSQTQKIEQSWVQSGQKKEALHQRKNERLKTEQETQNKNEPQNEQKQE